MKVKISTDSDQSLTLVDPKHLIPVGNVLDAHDKSLDGLDSSLGFLTELTEFSPSPSCLFPVSFLFKALYQSSK